MSKQPIRVLQVIGSMNRGGAESMIMNLYRKIDREQVQFDFLVQSDEEGQYNSEILELGGRIFVIRKFTGFNAISFYKDCLNLFSKHKDIQIVHGHIGSSAAIYLHAANKCNLFTIAHSHNAKWSMSLHDIIYYIYSFPTRYIAKQLFGCSTEAGISRFGKRAVSSNKYMNFHNAINLVQYSYNVSLRKQIRDKYNLNDGDVCIGTVGRLTDQKNPFFLFDIFKKAIEQHANVRCIWIGTGEYEEELRKKIKMYNLEERLIMTGVRNDVHEIVQAFDVFVFPSLWEGLPVTLIEAQTAGLPCVISDVISKEVDVTELVYRLNVTESAEIWAQTCYQKALENIEHRVCPYHQIKKSGYDINDTSKWLKEYYIDHVR